MSRSDLGFVVAPQLLCVLLRSLPLRKFLSSSSSSEALSSTVSGLVINPSFIHFRGTVFSL